MNDLEETKRSQLNSVSLFERLYPQKEEMEQIKTDLALNCGWGRLIFAQTFQGAEKLAAWLLDEKPGHRNIAFYVRDPHVLTGLYPHKLFLDPSHTYRLNLEDYEVEPVGGPIRIRPVASKVDVLQINRIYQRLGMMTFHPETVLDNLVDPAFHYWVAEEPATGQVLGTILGIDHKEAFNDPENGSSFWGLAVDPQTNQPGIGIGLVNTLAMSFKSSGRAFLDLSVMHDNAEVIRLYERMGFKRIPLFTLKKKNPVNEKLYSAPMTEEHLNPYARIITTEARRRGIDVEILDRQSGYFRLRFGGRSVVCWESLTEITSSIAMTICQDKSLTQRMLTSEGIKVPEQITSTSWEEDLAFLERHERVVVKPADGEQGQGITVDIRHPDELRSALDYAREVDSKVLLENFVVGDDLRVLVIGHKVVAAAIRRPAQVVGTGRHTILSLIERQSRRREAATGGESSIPIDEETTRCVTTQGYQMDSVLEVGKTLVIRKTANLHTGGTLHDVTDELHPELVHVSELASKVINIPVVGLDLLVKSPAEPEYVLIEANERPGLANHEPQPTAQRFMDLLFPLSKMD